MGWIVSLLFIVSGCITKDMDHFVVAGLFAIAGSLGSVAGVIKNGRSDG